MNWVSIVVFIDTSSFITPHIDFTILWTNNSLQKKPHFWISLPYIKINILVIMDEKRQRKIIHVSDLHARHNEKQNRAEIHSLYFLKSRTKRKRMTTTTTPTRSSKQQMQLAELA